MVGPALEYAGLADLNWPGAALGYLGYRAARGGYNYLSNRRSMQRQGTKRSRPGYNTFRPGARRPPPFKARRRAAAYKPKKYGAGRQSNAGTKYVVLKDLHGPWTLSSGDSPQQFNPSCLTNCPSWGFHSKCYKYYKLLWMKIDYHTTDHAMQAASCVTTDTVVVPTTMNQILIQNNCRIHDFTEFQKRCPSRTVFLKGVTGYEDFLPTGDANTDLVNAEANYRKINLNTVFRSESGGQLKPVFSFGVLFKGESQTTREAVANSSAITSARPM